MKKFLLLFIFATSVLHPGSGLAQIPHGIAGFVLGENIEQYRDRLRMDTVIPIRHMEYLSEVEVKDMKDFRSGYIRFGNCSAPGVIVRIKIKYKFSDKEFYNDLLEHYKAKFGEPTEWRGDPFHVYMAWKWSFKDENNNRISMTLQHYSSGDDEETPGNSVKLAMTNLWEEEEKCYEKKLLGSSDIGEEESEKSKPPRSEEDYKRLLPD